MNQKPEIGSRVQLATFQGSRHPPADCDPRENYWKLIGHSGTVLARLTTPEHVLVDFDTSVSSFGLHCHNPEPNSLRIKWTDLERA
jgi:hypothetical protein